VCLQFNMQPSGCSLLLDEPVLLVLQPCQQQMSLLAVPAEYVSFLMCTHHVAWL
jgi:hypothetical protein